MGKEGATSKATQFLMNGEVLQPEQVELRMKRDGRMLKTVKLGERSLTEVHPLGTALEKPYLIIWYPEEVDVKLTLAIKNTPDELMSAKWRLVYCGEELELFFRGAEYRRLAEFFGGEVLERVEVSLAGTRYRESAIEEVK